MWGGSHDAAGLSDICRVITIKFCISDIYSYICSPFVENSIRLWAQIIIKQLITNKMIKQYETVFIATPVLSEAQMKEAVKKYVDYIVAKGGEIVYEEDWGLRQLAYPIQKKTTGFYYLIEFKAEPTLIARLETQYRRDERIMRFLTFAMDKHAVAYAEKRRANKQAK